MDDEEAVDWGYDDDDDDVVQEPTQVRPALAPAATATSDEGAATAATPKPALPAIVREPAGAVEDEEEAALYGPPPPGEDKTRQPDAATNEGISPVTLSSDDSRTSQPAPSASPLPAIDIVEVDVATTRPTASKPIPTGPAHPRAPPPPSASRAPLPTGSRHDRERDAPSAAASPVIKNEPPAGWEMRYQTDSGAKYWFDEETGQTSWAAPEDFPAGSASSASTSRRANVVPPSGPRPKTEPQTSFGERELAPPLAPATLPIAPNSPLTVEETERERQRRIGREKEAERELNKSRINRPLQRASDGMPVLPTNARLASGSSDSRSPVPALSSAAATAPVNRWPVRGSQPLREPTSAPVNRWPARPQSQSDDSTPPALPLESTPKPRLGQDRPLTIARGRSPSTSRPPDRVPLTDAPSRDDNGQLRDIGRQLGDSHRRDDHEWRAHTAVRPASRSVEQDDLRRSTDVSAAPPSARSGRSRSPGRPPSSRRSPSPAPRPSRRPLSPPPAFPTPRPRSRSSRDRPEPLSTSFLGPTYGATKHGQDANHVGGGTMRKWGGGAGSGSGRGESRVEVSASMEAQKLQEADERRIVEEARTAQERQAVEDRRAADARALVDRQKHEELAQSSASASSPAVHAGQQRLNERILARERSAHIRRGVDHYEPRPNDRDTIRVRAPNMTPPPLADDRQQEEPLRRDDDRPSKRIRRSLSPPPHLARAVSRQAPLPAGPSTVPAIHPSRLPLVDPSAASRHAASSAPSDPSPAPTGPRPGAWGRGVVAAAEDVYRRSNVGGGSGRKGESDAGWGRRGGR